MTRLDSLHRGMILGIALILIASLTDALRAQSGSARTGPAPPTQPPPPAAAASQLGTPQRPCVGCGGKKEFGGAAGEVFVSAMIPYTMDRWVRNQPWSRIGLRSWGNNLRRGWEWDTDHFVANQFAHPYSGNLYFSSARSNGYGFWTSAPFALVGSALWEYFGETFRPSINDLANTTLGGISLGETTYRFACIILDNRTTGTERTFREIGAALVDPVRAFSRLMRGEIGRVGDNPADRLPSRVTASLSLGYQRLIHGPRHSRQWGPHQIFSYGTLEYGDPLAGDVAHPFGAFAMDAAAAVPGIGIPSQIRVGGYLAVHDLLKGERSNQQIQLVMHYHYYNNRAFETGGQGFSGTLVSRYPVGRLGSLRTEIWLTGFVLDAIKSDYSANATAIANETARDYDYGPGVGFRAIGRFTHASRWFVEATYQRFWIDVRSGTANDHLYHTFGLVYQVRAWDHVAFGERDYLYYRTSYYGEHPTTHSRDLQSQAFLTWSF